MANPRFAGLKAMADGSLLRTGSLHDKEYLVVPIVSAVGDRVWWPANSLVKELVPAEVLEAAYWSRNNRPIVAGHPRVNGEYVSANSPSILEQYSYGFTCNSTFEDKRVKVEAWFSREMAEKVGPAAINVISRLENGEMIEVSEGNYVVAVDEQGQVDGEEYKSKWITAINDHLATVNEGACNNEMGCGGPRVNQISAALSVNEVSKMNDKTKKESMFRRMFASMSEALKAAMSNNELRMKLFKVLSETQQGVSYVYDEDIDMKQVIYCVTMSYGNYWDTKEAEYHFYRRSFNMTADGMVSVNDDAIEVEWFEGWKDKGSNSQSESELKTSETVTEPCSCHKEKEVPVNVNEKKVLVSKLIGASKGFIPEELSESLLALSEDKLKSMLGIYEGTSTTPETTTVPITAPVTAPATETAPTQVAPDQVVISKEEYSDIKAAASAYRQQQEQYRISIISSIKTAQSAFTDEDLNSMSTPQLEKLATTLNVNEPASVDYSVRGRVESRVASAPTMRELPDTWGMNKTN